VVEQDDCPRWHNWRPVGAIRGKRIILDGKVENGMDYKFRAPRW
jgi:hypothetical protein